MLLTIKEVGWDGSPGVVKCGAAYSGKIQQIACSRALESLLEHQKVFLLTRFLLVFVNFYLPWLL